MKIYIAENIRKFRREKGITQEALADFLSVTFQSVSKWECGDTYPDLELIPSIANYFGVTVDDLLGTDDIKNEETIKACLDKYDRLDKKNTPESVEEKNVLAKQAYKDFPNDWRIIDIYRHSLTCGYTGEFDPGEVRRICGIILDGCPVDEYRYNAIGAMIYVAHMEKNDEEMEIYIKRLPENADCSQNEKRESVYWQSRKLDEYATQVQTNMMDYFGHAFSKALTVSEGYYGGNRFISPEDRIIVCEKMMEFIDCLFYDGNYGVWKYNIGLMHENMSFAYIMLGDYENGLARLEMGLDCYLKWDSMPDTVRYTSAFFDRVTYNKPEYSAFWDSFQIFLRRLNEYSVYDAVRDDERFVKIVERVKAEAEREIKQG